MTTLTLNTTTEALGWTLVHFLWQGSAIALLLWLALKFVPTARSGLRYNLSCLALLTMVTAAMATFVVLRSNLSGVDHAAAAPVMDAGELQRDHANDPKGGSMTTVRAPNATDEFSGMASEGAPWMSSVVTIWILGVALLSLRFLLNWFSVFRLRRSGEPVDPKLASQLEYLAGRIGISRNVRLLSSLQVRVPLVIGWIKPAILLPASVLTGLDRQHLTAILAHELAHIRRYDYLVNLLQNLLEALFFYHPAVWWASAQVRKEREHCCDDIAAKVTGGPLRYGQGLLALEEQLGATAMPRLGVAASGGALLARVRRLVEPADQPRGTWAAAVCLLLVVAILGLVVGTSTTAHAENGGEEGETLVVLERPEQELVPLEIASGELVALERVDGGAEELLIVERGEGEKDAPKPGPIFTRAKTDKKVVALTFMTGPHRLNTPAILEELQERKIKATFFVLGKLVDLYPEVAKQIVKDGHEIGNFTMNHPNLKKLGDEAVLKELKSCHAAISQATGVKPQLMRPPYGALTDEQRTLIEKEFGYRVVLWSIDPRDWQRPGPEVVAQRVLDNAHPGGIILLHDIHKPTATATPLILDGLVEKGYEFATVSELLALDGKN